MKKNKTNLTIMLVIVPIFLFSGCATTKPKIKEYKPYPSNSYLYNEIVDENKITWKTDLVDDLNEYKGYIKEIFAKINNHKTYLEKTNNIQIARPIQKKKDMKKNTEIDYSDSVSENEYKF